MTTYYSQLSQEFPPIRVCSALPQQWNIDISEVVMFYLGKIRFISFGSMSFLLVFLLYHFSINCIKKTPAFKLWKSFPQNYSSFKWLKSLVIIKCEWTHKYLLQWQEIIRCCFFQVYGTLENGNYDFYISDTHWNMSNAVLFSFVPNMILIRADI